MSELNISVLIIPKTILISGEIYTADKNFTMPLAVTAGTNLISDMKHVRLEKGIHHSISFVQKNYYYRWARNQGWRLSW